MVSACVAAPAGTNASRTTDDVDERGNGVRHCVGQVLDVVFGWGAKDAARDSSMGANAFPHRVWHKRGGRLVRSSPLQPVQLVDAAAAGEQAACSKVARTTLAPTRPSVQPLLVSPRQAMLMVERVYTIAMNIGVVRPKCTGATQRSLVRLSPCVDSHNVLSTAWQLVHWHVARSDQGEATNVWLSFDTRVRLAACLSLSTRFELEDGQTVDRCAVDERPALGVLGWHFLSASDQASYTGAERLAVLRRRIEREETCMVWGWPARHDLFAASASTARAAAELYIWRTLRRKHENDRLAARVALVYYTRVCALAGRFDLLSGERLNTCALSGLSCTAAGIVVVVGAETLARASEVVAVHSADVDHWAFASSALEFRRVVPGLRLGLLPGLKAGARSS